MLRRPPNNPHSSVVRPSASVRPSVQPLPRLRPTSPSPATPTTAPADLTGLMIATAEGADGGSRLFSASLSFLFCLKRDRHLMRVKAKILTNCAILLPPPPRFSCLSLSAKHDDNEQQITRIVPRPLAAPSELQIGTVVTFEMRHESGPLLRFGTHSFFP